MHKVPNTNSVSPVPTPRYINIVSRKYKFSNPEGLYFVSFATINWMDPFVRLEYNSRLAVCPYMAG